MVEADLDDEASLRKAFDGAYGAYVVTNYWVERTPDEEAARTRAEMELEQADNAARAARDAGVAARDLVDPGGHPRALRRRRPVPSLDTAGTRCRTSTPRARPTSCSRSTAYRPRSCGPPSTRASSSAWGRPGEDGMLALTLPMADQPLSGIAAEDIGRTALGIFKRGDEFVGRPSASPATT